jgi:Fur family ferric uptake transcriptional regulator
MTEEAKTEKNLLSLEERNEVLRQQGYRLTPQRYLVLQILEKVSEHVSLEELFSLVKQQYPHVNLSTMYRTLDLLQELFLVRETTFPGEPAKYEVFSGETHHHIVCQSCRRVLHVEDPLQKKLWEEVLQRYQFHEVTMDIMSRGYCDECWQQRRQAEP